MRKLDPATYPCPDHPDVDLTEQVYLEAYGPEWTQVNDAGAAALQRDDFDAAKLTHTQHRRTGRFGCTVTCPGVADKDGTKTSHEVPFHGRYL